MKAGVERGDLGGQVGALYRQVDHLDNLLRRVHILGGKSGTDEFEVVNVKTVEHRL